MLLMHAIGILLVVSVLVNILYHSKLPDHHTHNGSNSRHQPHLTGSFSLTSTELRHDNSQDTVIYFPMLWNSSGQVEQRNRKDGQIMHHQIHSLDETLLQGLSAKGQAHVDDKADLDQARTDRRRLLDLLQDAGVTDIDTTSLLSLPTDGQVETLYGDSLQILGLDRCQQFREQFPKHDASLGVAGLFNTGTNPLAMYLAANCVLPDNKSDRAGHGMRWQVPW